MSCYIHTGVIVSTCTVCLYCLQMVIGVTSLDPAHIHTLPEYPWSLPQSRVVDVTSLYKDGSMVGECPWLCVSPGVRVGVRHTDTQVIIYRNGSVHYTWDTVIPGPVWACVGLWDVTKFTVIEPGLLLHIST